MPFINLSASNLTTLYSALIYAACESKKHGQMCIVTFDQPLFMKSIEMVKSAEQNSDISGIIVRLGGFHLLMSYLGTIGYIMKGSGLEELWETVYGNDLLK